MNFSECLKIFKADIVRKLALEQKRFNLFNIARVMFQRGVVSVAIYRLKRYLYLKNSRLAKCFLFALRYPEFHYCHNELDPRAEIGPGLVLNNLGGIGLGFMVRIGENCTFMGKATPTLGAIEDVDFDVETIVIGNYCVIGHNVKVINAVKIADGVQIAPNSVVITNVAKPGAIVSGFPARIVNEANVADVKRWSPLTLSMIEEVNA